MNQPPNPKSFPPASKTRNPIYKFLIDPLRLLPDFLIIGVQKGGTSSLYRYLVQHPCIYSAATKEIHYFDQNFSQGLTWYRGHFPPLFKKYYKTLLKKEKFITGEATPYYIFHPLVPERVANLLPKTKLIILLRNPIDRAYSQYQHEVRLGFETLPSFEEAIAKEEDRMTGESDKIIKNTSYKSYSHQHYSYLSRGIYINQIKQWQHFFSSENILIFSSEDFFHNPEKVFKKTLQFLDLPEWLPKNFKVYNSNQYSTLHPETRQQLINYFKPYNQQLYNHLGVKFDWEH